MKESDAEDYEYEKIKERASKLYRARKLIGYKISDCVEKELLEPDEGLALGAVLYEAIAAYETFADEESVKLYLAKKLEEARENRLYTSNRSAKTRRR